MYCDVMCSIIAQIKQLSPGAEKAYFPVAADAPGAPEGTMAPDVNFSPFAVLPQGKRLLLSDQTERKSDELFVRREQTFWKTFLILMLDGDV